MSPHPGTIIADRFHIERQTAAGGAGRIYRALDRHTQGVVALKIVGQLAAKQMKRFERESALLAELQHPGIVRYIAHGRMLDGNAYLAMEWLDGVDMAHFLRSKFGTGTDPNPPNPIEHGDRPHPIPVDAQPQPREREPEPTQIRSIHQGTATAEGVELLPVNPPRTYRDEPSERQGQHGQHNQLSPPIRGLSVAEALPMARRVTTALAELHRRGIIHRDIKPANLFLVGGSMSQVKLLDLGTVHLPDANERLTRTGNLLGTPHYMAPEQASAGHAIQPATDVWGLGCVLYQAFTGLRPFRGADILSVLTRIVNNPPTPIQDLRPDLPPLLADLIMRSLQKDPKNRPADAMEIAAVLERMSEISVGNSPIDIGGSNVAPVLTGSERRVQCFLLVDDSQLTSTSDEAFGQVAAPFGLTLQRIDRGTLLASANGSLPPRDQAAQTARVALALQSEYPSLYMKISTSRSEVLQSLDTIQEQASESAEPVGELTSGAIRVDDPTASLLEPRFACLHRDERVYLTHEHPTERVRTLLGKPSRWVGRRRELATLNATYEESAEEHIARAILVTGQPGMGKSRLVAEFLHLLNRRGDAVTVVESAGDPISSHSPLNILARALRRMVGILSGASVAEKRALLRQHMAAVMSAERVEEAAPILDILMAIDGSPDGHIDGHIDGHLDGHLDNHPQGDRAAPQQPDSAHLHRARRDPLFMSKLMEREFVALLDAECNRQPLVLVLDDLHWCDSASIVYLDNALKSLEDRPFFLLALARPEISTEFPRLWEQRSLHTIELTPLSNRAATTMARDALGPAASEATIADLVDRANGNAFYLEELIRAAAEEREDTIPDSVIGMVHARLDGLGTEAKRILRAASVFGETFWRNGVEVLVGDVGAFDVDEWLADLSEREILQRCRGSHLPNQREYRFCHSLLRDASYAMLTDEDARLGHALAGDWLLSAGETDSRVLGEHFWLGGDPERALAQFIRAAEQALKTNEMAAALASTARAVEIGAEGPMLGWLRAIETIAYSWLPHLGKAREAGTEAIELLPAGSALWYSSIGYVAASCLQTGDGARIPDLMAAALTASCASGAENDRLISLCRICYGLLLTGQQYQTSEVLAHIAASANNIESLEVRTLAQVNSIQALYFARLGNASASFEYSVHAIHAFERSRDFNNAVLERNNLCLVLLESGDYASAEANCEHNLEYVEKNLITRGRGLAYINLGASAGCQGRIEEGHVVIERGIDDYRQSKVPPLLGMGYIRHAEIDFFAGNLDSAMGYIDQACEILTRNDDLLAFSLAIRARLLLRGTGTIESSLADAEKAMAIYRRLDGLILGAHLPRLAISEVYAAMDHDSARASVGALLDMLEKRVAVLPDPLARKRYLEKPDVAPAKMLAQKFALSWPGDTDLGNLDDPNDLNDRIIPH